MAVMGLPDDWLGGGCGDWLDGLLIGLLAGVIDGWLVWWRAWLLAY
jgi:hypothetical protein